VYDIYIMAIFVVFAWGSIGWLGLLYTLLIIRRAAIGEGEGTAIGEGGK
jgi:hypothetical protein